MPKINKVTYNGTASDTLGVFVTGTGSYDASEADVTAYSVPGKNGDILIPENRWKNIEIIYPAFVVDFSNRVQAIRNWLTSSLGYTTLSDSYDTTHYREAVALARKSFEPAMRVDGANFQLVFNCKPQRFLNTGYDQVTLTTGDDCTNPTQFKAYPRFAVTGMSNGATITVTNSLGTFTLTSVMSRSSTFYIDCELCTLYSGSTNLNALMGGTFPVFAPGSNTVTFSGIATLKVRPRWWEL